MTIGHRPAIIGLFISALVVSIDEVSLPLHETSIGRSFRKCLLTALGGAHSSIYQTDDPYRTSIGIFIFEDCTSGSERC